MVEHLVALIFSGSPSKKSIPGVVLVQQEVVLPHTATIHNNWLCFCHKELINTWGNGLWLQQQTGCQQVTSMRWGLRIGEPWLLCPIHWWERQVVGNWWPTSQPNDWRASKREVCAEWEKDGPYPSCVRGIRNWRVNPAMTTCGYRQKCYTLSER